MLPSCGGLVDMQVLVFSSPPAGVPGRFGPPHGEGPQEGQEGSVDQRLPGRAGTSGRLV